MDEDDSKEESCESCNPHLDDGDYTKLYFSTRELLLRERKSSPRSNEEAEISHEEEESDREHQ